MPDLVVLVENGACMPTIPAEVSEGLSVVRLRPDRNLGCAGGRNLGLNYLLANSTVETFATLDNDTVVPSDFVDRVSRLALGPLAVAAPTIWELDNARIWSAGGLCHTDGSIEQLRQGAPLSVCDWAPGACLVMSRSTWSRVGPFDPWINFLFEDVEWCYRLRKLGGQVCVRDEIKLLHQPSQSLGGEWSPTRVRYWARNGTFWTCQVYRSGKSDTLRWLYSETLKVLRDLNRRHYRWSAARLRGLAEGLCESFLRSRRLRGAPRAD